MLAGSIPRTRAKLLVTKCSDLMTMIIDYNEVSVTLIVLMQIVTKRQDFILHKTILNKNQ
jgi:hypothetical protein